MVQVKKGDFIQMEASLAGDDFSWSPRQVLRVGKDIEPDFASALVNEPSHEPRAHLLSKEDGKRRFDAQNVEDLDEPFPTQEIPPEEGDETEEGGAVNEREREGETRDEQAGMETATNPQVETRETATAPQRRGGKKRVKPPTEEDEEPKAE